MVAAGDDVGVPHRAFQIVGNAQARAVAAIFGRIGAGAVPDPEPGAGKAAR